jgi:DNA-binding NtrC family response regulator
VSASHAQGFQERRRGTRLFHFRALQTMNPRPLHVLLIIGDAQDEADIRQKLGEARNTSFAVRAAASLSEALQQIAKNSCDVFLIDVAVPDSDGVRGLQRLVTATKNVPVIILTAQPSTNFTKVKSSPVPKK